MFDVNDPKFNFEKIESYPRAKVVIYDETLFEFYLFKHENKNICIRKEGDVYIDPLWEGLDNKAKVQLKEFLGGMYLAEIKHELKAGKNFFLKELNE